MAGQRFTAGNRRGMVIVFVAVSMAALLSMAALAIDLSVLYKTRAEAQRAADASALAGASAFLDSVGTAAVPLAHQRAWALADTNTLQGGDIDVSTCTTNGLEYLCPEMTVEVVPDSEKVRVWIYRRNVGTFFARIFGVHNRPIGAKAAAEATEAGTANCVKPFIIPDYWSEGNTAEDLNTNDIWDLPVSPPQPFKCGDPGVECWGYEPSGSTPDTYRQYGDSGTASNAWTGLLSEWRNLQTDSYGHRYERDVGRPIMLYPGLPAQSPTPSNWYLWRIDCPGGACVREAICDPNAPGYPQECGCLTSVSISDTLASEQPGQVEGPVAQGLEDWINTDPSARFETFTDGSGYQRGQVVSNIPGKSGYNNPRVFVAALMEPGYLQAGYDEVPILNLARFFLESAPTQPGSKEPIVARFLGFASGLGPEDPNLGTLVKVLRLVE